MELNRRKRAAEIQDSIRQILFREWDPIGVGEFKDWPEDEYDAYIAPIYKILNGSRSENDIIDYLYMTEKNHIGVWCKDPEGLRPVARKLLGLDIRFLEFGE